MSEKYLIVGATGNTGSGIAQTLLKSGKDVRVFVGNAEKAQSLKDAGAEVIVGDLDKPETIAPAVAGVDKIYLLTWNGDTGAQQAINVIEAVKSAGTNAHIVRQSGWGTEKSRIIKQHAEVEKVLADSGLPWTVVKPTFFMQNTMMAAQTIISDSTLYWDWAEGKAGIIDVRDIVSSAVAVLTGSGHEGKTYELSGPASISFGDVASTLSKVLGKEVKYVPVPGEAAKGSMVQMGIPEWIADGFVELGEGFKENYANRTTDNVANLTGKQPISYEQFVGDFKQAFTG